MMKIYSNEYNPAGLKLLIAAKYSNREIEQKIVNISDGIIPDPKHLPYLEIDQESFIFVPNAAVWYLLPPPEDLSDAVSQWIEWESVVLVPHVVSLFGAAFKSDCVSSGLSKALSKLNSALADTVYLTGNEPNASDIVIWSTLYPFYCEGSLCHQYLSETKHIIQWIQSFEKFPQVKEALSIFKLSSAVASYQGLLSGAKYLLTSQSARLTNDTYNQSQSDVITAQELEAAKHSWFTKSESPKIKTKPKIVLPDVNARNVLITSALPYVNNVPHLGNIIGCVLSADVFARFCRICNYNTLYIGGTDEYGTATETKALEEGLSCKAICDKYYAIHKDIYDWFNISFDYFGRSSAPEQTELCQDLFLQLNDNGFMFTEPVEQLHCEKCNRYLADRFVEGGCPHPGCNYEDARGDQCDGCGKLVNSVELKNPRCKICRSTPKLKTSKQFFIDLPKLEPLLLHWMKQSANGWSNNAQVIGKAWLREGLKPRCITRDLKWGVPVPLNGFRDKVFYVWFDAPIGYMSITKAYTENWEQWWRPSQDHKITLFQFMAKDNVPFHSVMFPACLLGANRNYITVSHIMATEYLNYEDGKFSKSRGVGVFGNDARDTGIASDVWRFYLLYVRPETQDSSFSWADLATKNNSELLNNLGNFINRALVFAKNNFNKSIPEIEPNDDDFTLLALCTRELKSYISCLEKCKLRDGIRHILAISRHGNQYMQVNQPWVLLKGSAKEKARAGTVIGICCNLACLLSALLHPYMPDTSNKLKKQLNAPDFSLNTQNIEITCLLPAGHSLGEPSPLFIKLDAARVEELKAKFAGKRESTPPKINGVSVSVTSDNVTSGAASEENQEKIKQLEEQVSKQGSVVRKLKESGASKTEWQPEVNKLLELKNSLSILLGGQVAGPQKGKKKK